MEIHSQNLIDTTTAIAVLSGTATAQYLIDRNADTTYQTIGYDNGTTASVICTIDTPRIGSHLIIKNHNLKSFDVYINSTSVASVTGNSASSHYISFSSVTVSSVSFYMYSTTSGEKSVGELMVSERRFIFERNPTIDDYKPTVFRKQVEHEMPDGGSVLYNIRDKFRAKISWDFITADFHTQLQDLYEEGDPFVFFPFPTTTSWDGKAYEVVWPGQFDFKHSTNDKTQGYSGSLQIKETPSA